MSKLSLPEIPPAVMPDVVPAPTMAATGAAGLTQQILEALPDGVVIADKDWIFTFANRRAQELVANTPLIGHHLFKLFPGNNDEPFNTSYRTTMETRQPTSFEAFNGEPLNTWYKVQAEPFTLADDNHGIIIFFSNIDERKRAELRERETADRLARMLEATTDSVVMLDREWRYTFLNGKARLLLADPDSRLLGQIVWEAFPDIVESPAGEMLRRAMRSQASGSVVFFYPEPLNRWLYVQAEPTADGVVIFFRDVTEDKQNDEQLRDQQDLLAAVQEVARLCTWEIDVQTGIKTWGPGSFTVWGHPLSELVTLAQRSRFMQPVYIEEKRIALERAVENGEDLCVEYPVTAADGSTVWIENRGRLVPGTQAAPRVRGMSMDITRRKLFEMDLIASEARYRVLADLNPQAIWMGDPQGNITYANQGFMAYLGLTAERLTGQGWLDAFAPYDRERVQEVWSRSVRTGCDYDIEAHLCHAATKAFRWWHLRAAPIRDEAGVILNWLGVGSDIHDAKTYAENLRMEQAETERRRAELETIYRTTPIGLALLDPVDFRFLNLNDHEAEMLGFAKDEILNRPLAEIAPPDKLPGLMEMMRSVARGAVIKDRLLEGELTARPGEKRAWRVNYSPVFNEDGSVRAISTASIEITNQKKAESALIQSEKLAAVGRLASSISHEINNPLEAITNLLYLIALDDKLPPELRGYVHMAQSELSRVSQIATQTLRFHRQAVNPTYVTAEELVGAVIRLYTGRLSNSSIKVDARYDAKIKILCFENDIRQVLNNLIANAIDAMRTGGRLIVRAHLSDGGVRITIADTGHGMSKRVQSRLFEPFFTTKDLNGTGLGLWISANIVARHQGQLRCRSSDTAEHHGTVFTLFLPREETPIHEDD